MKEPLHSREVSRAYREAVLGHGDPRGLDHAQRGRGRRRGLRRGMLRQGRRPTASARLRPSRSTSPTCRRSARRRRRFRAKPLGLRDADDRAAGLCQRRARRCVWNSDNEPGRVTVRGALRRRLRAFTGADGGLCPARRRRRWSAPGVGPLGQDELDRIVDRAQDGLRFRHRRRRLSFSTAQTRAGGSRRPALSVRRQAGRCRGGTPGPIERAKATRKLAYKAIGGEPDGVLDRDLDWLLHDRDPRYATPDARRSSRAATPEGFRAGVVARCSRKARSRSTCSAISTARRRSPRCRARSARCRRASRLRPTCSRRGTTSRRRRRSRWCSTTPARPTRRRR